MLSTLGATLAVAVLSFALANFVADRKRRQVADAWAASLGTLEDILARHPPRGANATARELEVLSAELGIDLAPRWGEAPERPAPARVLAFRGVKRELGSYLDTQLARPDAASDPAPPALAAFLADNDAALETLRARLLASEPPRWESAPQRLAAAPPPNLLGHIDLHKLLVADALHRASAGDDDGALRDLDASWQLDRSLTGDPLLISRTISMSTASLQAGALRHVEGAPARWRERLATRDDRRAVVEALQFESWIWSAVQDTPSDFAVGPWQQVAFRVARPYVRYCAADVSSTVRERLVRLAELEWLCDRDLAELGADLEIEISPWNWLRTYAPKLWHVVGREARLELDLELTGKLLELRAARAARDGAWPRHLDGIERSTACPGDRWIYETTADGGMSLALSREPDWDETIRGADLPLRFSVAGDAGRRAAAAGRAQLPPSR